MSEITNLIFIFGAKYLYLFVIVIAFLWFLRQPKPKKKEIFIFACICLPAAFFISRIAGYLYYNPQPFVLSHFQPLIHHKIDNGFPSHHTLLVSAIAATAFVFSRRTGYVLWFLALGVGVSRVYVGVHHVVDIIGGILISILSAGAAYFLMRRLK